MKMSFERQRLNMGAILLLWCIGLVGYRIFIGNGGDGKSGIGLLWNLFLATVPLLWSYIFRWAAASRRLVWSIVSFTLWLLFLPNAPYLLTDLIHLAPRTQVPLWFVLCMLLSCAGTGTLLGYHSLLNVHRVIERRYGDVVGWFLASGSLMACGFGIYLGPFLRWNSWDALTKPLKLFKTVIQQCVNPGIHPHPFAVTLFFGTGLLLGYLAVRTLGRPIESTP